MSRYNIWIDTRNKERTYCRVALESIAYQSKDVIETVKEESHKQLNLLSVDEQLLMNF